MTDPAIIRFVLLHPEAKPPARATPMSIGLDIYANLISDTGRPNKVMIPPRNTRAVRTGLMVEAPPDHYLIICSRSGLAKNSIFVTNAPGIIDPDYRGELMVLLYNGSHESYYVSHHDRIGQVIAVPCVWAESQVVDSLSPSPTSRGTSGFGSTGQ